MQSEKQHRKIAWLIRVPLGAVDARNATLIQWLKNTSIHPTYMLIQSPDLTGRKMSHQGIISNLRATYADQDVHFSVISEKRGRMLISVSSSKEITKSEKEHWFHGLRST